MKEVTRKSIENGNHVFQGGETQRCQWALWRQKNGRKPRPDDWKYLTKKEDE